MPDRLECKEHKKCVSKSDSSNSDHVDTSAFRVSSLKRSAASKVDSSSEKVVQPRLSNQQIDCGARYS